MPRIEERHRRPPTTGKALLAANGVLGGIALWLLLQRPKPCPPCGPTLLATSGSDGTLGPNVTLVTSNDGITWTARPTPFDGTGNGGYVGGVAYAPTLGIWVAVGLMEAGSSGQTVMTSPDGLTWTLVASPFDGVFPAQGIDVVWAPGLGRFVAVGYGGGTTVALSADGVTWEPGTTATPEPAAVVWIEELGLLVAGIFAGETVAPVLYTSPDGVAWTPRPSPLDSPLNAAGSCSDVAYASELGLLVAVGASGGGIAAGQGTNVTIITSTDGGMTWIAAVSPFDGGECRGVIWADWLSPPRFVAVGGIYGVSGSGVPTSATSTDGVHWSGAPGPFPGTSGDQGGLAVRGDATLGLIAAGRGPTVLATSPDGASWTPRPSPLDAMGLAANVAIL